MTPHEKIAAHEDLITLIIDHEYLPQASQGNFAELLSAMKELNPSGNYCPTCSGGIIEVAREARAHLKLFKEQLKRESVKFHTFPNHEKKK